MTRALVGGMTRQRRVTSFLRGLRQVTDGRPNTQPDGRTSTSQDALSPGKATQRQLTGNFGLASQTLLAPRADMDGCLMPSAR